MLVGGSDDSPLPEVVQGSTVTSLFHEEELLAVPGVKIDGLHKGIDDSILSMLACTVKTEMDTQMDRRPLGILFLTV